MSFQDPFGVDSSLGKTGCSCGAHANQPEHDEATALSGDERLDSSSHASFASNAAA